MSQSFHLSPCSDFRRHLSHALAELHTMPPVVLTVTLAEHFEDFTSRLPGSISDCAPRLAQQNRVLQDLNVRESDIH